MKQILLVATCLLFYFTVNAQKDSISRPFFINILPNKPEAGFSINPDYASLRLGINGYKWKNMAGSNIPLVETGNKNHFFFAQLSGFIELHNLLDNQIMSWQLWRGNLGIDFYWRPTLKNPAHKLQAGLLFHHESQHVTDMITFNALMLKYPYLFDNATARSFEYRGIDLKYDYDVPALTRKRLTVRTTIRQFPQPILQGAARQQLWAYSIETGFRIQATDKGTWLYLHAFYEQVFNNFIGAESIYISQWNRQPFTYFIVEGGIWFSPPGSSRSVNLFVTGGKYNGRGLDFINVYTEAGMGVRFNL